jgi:L-fuconolactonase
MIIDTHCHVVSGNKEKYPQQPNPPAWPLTTVETMLSMMDESGIGKALLVQTYFTYKYDNRYMAESALAHSNRLLAVAILDPVAPDTPDTLSQLVEKHGVRGLRMMNDTGHMPVTMDDPKNFPVWERAEKLGIPLCLAALLPDVARAAVPLERFPNVKVCLDHIWGLKLADSPRYESLKPVLDLARYPNAHIKIAPNNSFAIAEAGGSHEAFYNLLLEHFGSQRILWGSNYPAHSKPYGGLKSRTDLARKEFAYLSPADRDAIMGGNALRLWPGLS